MSTARDRSAAFETLVLPHARAGYNVARWMTRNDHDAEDLVQEASVRAFKYWDGWRGDNVRTWFLAIVRNLGRDWIQRNRTVADSAVDHQIDVAELASGAGDNGDPEAAFIRSVTAQAVEQAIHDLPPDFRKVLLLREQDGLPYKEIADLAGIPLGTVMSRLARARSLVQRRLVEASEPGRA